MRGLVPTVAWVAIAVGCVGTPAERIRQVTYPPDLQYIGGREIHTAMGALASDLVALDRELGFEGGPRSPDPDRVVEILSRMQGVAASLKRREHSTHPRIDAYAPMLQRDIERALLGARSDPPSYAAAGRISGACGYCHAPPPGARDAERVR